MVPRGEAPAMIAEVETEVLPSLRIQFVGNGSVIESLPSPRMAVKQPVPVAHGADATAAGRPSAVTVVSLQAPEHPRVRVGRDLGRGTFPQSECRAPRWARILRRGPRTS